MTTLDRHDLSDNIFVLIKDKFENGDAGTLMLTCPIDRETFYDIFEEDDVRTLSERNSGAPYTPRFYVVVNDKASDEMTNYVHEDLAKRAIARHIAAKIIAAQEQMRRAADYGLFTL
jgi:hypothetical protein